MTPRITLKPMLLKMAAFTALAAGLTPPAAQAAPPAPAPKPAAPAIATGRLHWETLLPQHTALGAVRTLTGWDRGGALPEGVSRVFFLESNGSILFQATLTGSAHMREAVKAIEAVPQPVQLRVTFATITAADLAALTPRFYEISLDSQGAMVKWLRVFRPGTDVSAVAAFLAASANRKVVVVAPVTTTNTGMAATINIEGAPPMPGSRSTQLVITPRIDRGSFVTLQMLVPSLLSADGNAPPPVRVLQQVSSGATVVMVGSLPPATSGGNRYLLICVTPTVAAGVDPAPAS